MSLLSLHTAAAERPAVSQAILENGFQAVWETDARQPLVAIEARIAGGLRAEGPLLGTGITHFIEHMLFKGTPTRPPGTIEQEVRRYGGTINAFTSYDTTGVTLFVEAGSLRPALEMLADILQNAQFDAAEFEKERAVIISEIKMNLDDPDRRISRLFWSRHYLEHPYRHPILGYQPQLEQLTVAELTDFYHRQYQPQNITLACVGALDPATFPDMVTELFGAWPRGRYDPSQHLVPAEPQAVAAKEATEVLPIQTAYAILGFSSTNLFHSDVYPLDVLANILGQGRSSRLYETIVRQRRLADTLHAWNYTPQDPGVFGVSFRSEPAQVDAARAAILDVIEQVKANGVTDAELHKAKRQVLADYYSARQTVESRAGDFASSMAATGNPLFSERYVQGIEAVTAAQVQDVARRYCDATRMTTAIIRPPVPQDAAAPAAGDVSTPVTRSVLANKATVIVGRDAKLPLVGITVAFRGGVRAETGDTQGLSNLTAHMLNQGTKRRTALDIATYVEGLGGALQPFSGRDEFGVMLQVLAEDADEGLALLHELLTQSTFPAPELDIQRSLLLKELEAQEDEVFDVGSRLLRHTLFPSHPYGFNPLGTKETLPRLTREHCAQFAKQWMVPSNMAVSLFGDLEPNTTTRLIEQTFGAMPSAPSPWPAAIPQERLTSIKEATQSVPKEQSVIVLGFHGTTRVAPDRPALDVMTAIMSGMAGRLFQAVREEHGLAYTLGAAHAPGWDDGYLLVYAATRPKEEARVIALLEEQLELARKDGFTDEEVEQAKRYLIGNHRMDLQSLLGLSKRSAIDELLGLGYDAWTTYESRINAVANAAVHQAAQQYITLQQRAQVIVSPNGADTHP